MFILFLLDLLALKDRVEEAFQTSQFAWVLMFVVLNSFEKLLFVLDLWQKFICFGNLYKKMIFGVILRVKFYLAIKSARALLTKN